MTNSRQISGCVIEGNVWVGGSSLVSALCPGLFGHVVGDDVNSGTIIKIHRHGVQSKHPVEAVGGIEH